MATRGDIIDPRSPRSGGAAQEGWPSRGRRGPTGADVAMSLRHVGFIEVFTILCFWTGSDLARGDDAPPLPDDGRIVFVGDSITQAGHYVVDVELFLLTRFPGRAFEVINHGISSETISGTSEPDHDPRRPDAHE